MATGFFWDERCFWHQGGNYAFTLPAGGLVQPGGGLPESPETKRRLKNLIEATGLIRDLAAQGAAPATEAELARVHPADYLGRFRALSDAGGGELGLRAPFGRGGYEIAALSAGLAVEATRAVLAGRLANAYALSRPPGHHCLPDFPNGFCLLANIAVAVEAALAEGRAGRIAVLDWDVHHGNGTEAIFYARPEVLTISIHQERNYPLDTGGADARGEGAGAGANLNVPLPPGCGHRSYLESMERIVLPALARFRPDAIVVACGYDAAAVDPLGRMLATAETFRAMTAQVMAAAADLCGGRLVLVHEGGYSEVYVPFCGHAVLEELSASRVTAPDPLAGTFAARQPSAAFEAFVSRLIGEMAAGFGLQALAGRLTAGPASATQAPAGGPPMPDPNPAAMDFLLTRRSRPARTLAAPVPGREDLERLLTAAARSPDHGMLVPWRFVVLQRPALRRLGGLAAARAAEEGLDPERVQKAALPFSDGNLAVAVVFSPKPSDKIPEFEQLLSAGAVCLSLVNAALASGWGASWITGWAAYDEPFRRDGLGLAPDERVAGFVHIGTETVAPPERPRPDLSAITTWVEA